MEPDHTSHHFGEQLKSKREAMGLSVELVSSHLKLSSRIILKLEQFSFGELPSSFIKGYLKSYAKYLQFSEQEIQGFLRHFTVKSAQSKTTLSKMHPIQIHQKNPSKLVMRSFTALVTLTLMTLSAAWWYNQADTHTDEDRLISIIKSEQPVMAYNQARLFSQVLDTLQHPKQNFTSLPPQTTDTGKTVAVNKNTLAHADDEEAEDEDDEEEDTGTTEHE